MKINCLFCIDCAAPMHLFDIGEHYCSKTKLIVRLEERVCLQCGNGAMQIAEIVGADEACTYSRTETIDVTCTQNSYTRRFPRGFVYNLVKIYFWETAQNICLSKHGCVWYQGYEIDLWHAAHGLTTDIKLSADYANILRLISRSLKLWVINPDDWQGCEMNRTPFIKLDRWHKLLYKRKSKFKNVNEQSNTGTAA